MVQEYTLWGHLDNKLHLGFTAPVEPQSLWSKNEISIDLNVFRCFWATNHRADVKNGLNHAGRDRTEWNNDKFWENFYVGFECIQTLYTEDPAKNAHKQIKMISSSNLFVA